MFYETLETRSMFSVAVHANFEIAESNSTADVNTNVAAPTAPAAQTTVNLSTTRSNRATEIYNTAERPSGATPATIDRIFSTRLISAAAYNGAD